MYVSKMIRPPLFQPLFDLTKASTGDERRNVIRAAIRYILREEIFNNCFKPFVSSELPRVREMLCKFDFAIRLKISFLECRAQNANLTQAKQIFTKNGLTNDDAWVWLFAQTIETPKTDAWLAAGNKIPTPREIRQESFDLIYTGTVSRVIRGAVRSKLWFVSASQPITLEDLEADVRMNALESYYSTTPFLVEAHKKPAIVRSAQNYISKLISHFTYSKRAGMVNNGGKFTHTTVSLDEKIDVGNMNDKNELSRYWYAAVDTQTAIDREKFEKFDSIRSLRDKTACPKAKAAFSIIGSCSNPDTVISEDRSAFEVVKQFLMRMSEKFKQKFRNVLEVVDEIGVSKFLNEVRAFAGVSMKKWKQNLIDLQEGLSGPVLITT